MEREKIDVRKNVKRLINMLYVHAAAQAGLSLLLLTMVFRVSMHFTVFAAVFYICVIPMFVLPKYIFGAIGWERMLLRSNEYLYNKLTMHEERGLLLYDSSALRKNIDFRARYARIATSKWFKDAYEDMTMGETINIK